MDSLEGDLNASFGHCSKLKTFSVWGCGERLHGNASMFENMPEIESIQISGVKLSGDLNVSFQKCRNLKEVLIARPGSELVGSIETAFKSCQELEHLGLWETNKVSGKIAQFFEKRQGLKTLILSECRVAGDFTGDVVKAISEIRQKGIVTLKDCAKFHLHITRDDIEKKPFFNF